MRESPEHGSGAELRTTAVTEPKHARAPITEDWIKNITYLIAAKNTRVPEFLVFGLTDMHEESSEEFTVGELDDRLANDSETINRQCELVVLHSAERSFLE